jgi:quercetin dioxygenase-like cupin family protein
LKILSETLAGAVALRIKSPILSFVGGALAALCLLSIATPKALAQKAFGVCRPLSERKTELGCWMIADTKVGRFGQAETYWHLDRYSSRAAADRAKGPRSTVIESFGKVWLLSIEPRDWKPSVAGEHAASIGPLRVTPGKEYSALFMEAVMNPGDTSSVHRHSGPEAWYTLSGETCLETPTERIVGTPGHPAIVPEGPPMFLRAIGKERRRSIVLILHDADQQPTTMAHDWTPKGVCKP